MKYLSAILSLTYSVLITLESRQVTGPYCVASYCCWTVASLGRLDRPIDQRWFIEFRSLCPPGRPSQLRLGLGWFLYVSA
jgi:hypothetical protein